MTQVETYMYCSKQFGDQWSACGFNQIWIVELDFLKCPGKNVCSAGFWHLKNSFGHFETQLRDLWFLDLTETADLVVSTDFCTAVTKWNRPDWRADLVFTQWSASSPCRTATIANMSVVCWLINPNSFLWFTRDLPHPGKSQHLMLLVLCSAWQIPTRPGVGVWLVEDG